MSAKLKCLTLNTPNLEKMVAFFQALGIELNPGRVNKGSAVYKGVVAGFEMSLMSIQKLEKTSTPDLALQFEVSSLLECENRLKKMGDLQFIMDPTELPYGKVMVVLDPDGHSVELIETGSEVK